MSQYIQTIFGKYKISNIRGSSLAYDPLSSFASNQNIQVKRWNVLSPSWINTYGNPLDDYNNGQIGGYQFNQNNFDCDINNQSNAPSFKGKVISFVKNVARVLNDRNE